MPDHDVAVIGAGLPGLTAAVLLARANRRVIVIDPEGEPGGILVARELDGMPFAAGPVITHGFEPGGTLRVLHAALGIPLSADMNHVPYQVALPDRRITVFPERSATIEEMRREFPGEISRIISIYRDLPERFDRIRTHRSSSMLARWQRASSYLTDRQASPELRSFFDVQARFFFGRSLTRLSLADFCALVSFAPVRLPLGFHGIARQLRDRLSTVGGEFLGGTDWPELQFRSKNAFSIDLASGVLAPRVVIINSSWKADYTVFLSLRAEGIPVGMEDTVICCPSYERPDDLYVLTLQGTHGPGLDKNALRSLTVSFLAHAAAALTGEDRSARIASVMPFVEEHITAAGELDLSVRRYPYAGPWGHSIDYPADGPQMRTVNSSRHLYLLHDRAHAVNDTVASGWKLSEKLAS